MVIGKKPKVGGKEKVAGETLQNIFQDEPQPLDDKDQVNPTPLDHCHEKKIDQTFQQQNKRKSRCIPGNRGEKNKKKKKKLTFSAKKKIVH